MSEPAEGEPFSLIFEANGDGFELNDAGELRSFDYLGNECVDWMRSVTVKPGRAWQLALDVSCVENPLIRLMGDWRAVMSEDST